MQGEVALAEELAAAAADVDSANTEASQRACKALLYDLMDADPLLRSGGGGSCRLS